MRSTLHGVCIMKSLNLSDAAPEHFGIHMTSTGKVSSRCVKLHNMPGQVLKRPNRIDWVCFSLEIYNQSCGTNLVLKICHNALTIPNQHETMAPMSGVQLARSLHKGLGKLRTWMSVQHFSMLKAYTSAMSRPTEL